MARVNTNYSAWTALSVTALDGLPTSATHVSGAELPPIDNTSTKYKNILLSGKFTAPSSPTAGEWRLWVVPRINGTTLPGGFDGTASQETTPLDDENGTLAGAMLVASGATDTTASQVYNIKQVNVAQFFGGVVPEYLVPFFTHSMGANMPTGGHELNWQGVYDTVD